MGKPVNSSLADLRSGVGHLPLPLPLLGSDWGRGCRVKSPGSSSPQSSSSAFQGQVLPWFCPEERSFLLSITGTVHPKFFKTLQRTGLDLGGKTEPLRKKQKAGMGSTSSSCFLTSDPELRGSTSQNLTSSVCKGDLDLSRLPWRNISKAA